MLLKLKRMLSLGAIAILLLIGIGASSVVFGHSEFGTGSFGGELRGATRVTGRVLCLACTVKDMQEAFPEHGPDLYVFKNGTQQAVFQVTAVGKIPSGEEASQLAHWIAITGLNKQINVRMNDKLWQSLTAAENIHKEVELTGLLRSTRTFDVAVITPVDAQ
ncbi:MAG: hypothetical protein AB7P69_22355 [Candidatus Binatia bacterium]